MPNKDKTGPEGKGSKTGLKKGDCKKEESKEEKEKRIRKLLS